MTKIALTVVALLAVGCGIRTPGEGEKIGQIVRATSEGIFCTTFEAQLIRGGMTDGSGSFGVTPFTFTITGSTQAEQIKQYMRDQTEVIIRYRTEGFYSLCRSGSGGDFLVSVSPAPSALSRTGYPSEAWADEPEPTPVATATPAPTAAPEPCGADGMPSDPTKPCTMVVNPLAALTQRVGRLEATQGELVRWVQQQNAAAQQAQAATGKKK